MRYANIYLKLLLPGASQQMRVTGSDRRLDLNLAVGAYRAVEVVQGAFARIAEIVRLWRVRRKTVETLLRLDERLLRDIGLRRDQIPAFVEQLATRPKSRRGDDLRPEFSSDDVSLTA